MSGGFSRVATRSRRKPTRRCCMGRSSSFKSLRASGSNSISQAKRALHVGQGNGLAALAGAGFREVVVLKVVDMFENCLARQRGLGAARFQRQGGEALFDHCGQANGEHGVSPGKYALKYNWI